MARIRSLVILSLSLGLLAAGCEKKEVYPVWVPIGFLVDVSITPSSRTMQRGDTLWLEAHFSDSLLDMNSGKRYRVRPQDLKLGSFMVFEQLQGIGQPPTGIAPTFRLLEQIGTAKVNGSFTSNFEPIYDGHFYRLRIGLIPTKAGITSIAVQVSPRNPQTGAEAVNDFLPFIQLPPDAQGREQLARLTYSFYIINGGKANNFDLYSQSTKTIALEPGTVPNTVLYETKSRFTVEVK